MQRTVINLRIEGFTRFALSKGTGRYHASTGISPIEALIAVVFSND